MSEPTPLSSGSAAESDGDRAALYDFVYLDRPRVSAYYAQLLNEGVLTGETITEGASTAAAATGGVGSTHIASASRTSNKTAHETRERQFDPAMMIAIDAFERLEDEGSIADTPLNSELGGLIHADGTLTILDIGLIQAMWDPIGRMTSSAAIASLPQPEQFTNSQQRKVAKQNVERVRRESSEQMKAVAEIAKAFPHPIQGSLRTAEDITLWATLDAEHFVGSPQAMALKHGSTIAGVWSMIALLDARPDADQTNASSNPPESASEILRIMAPIQQLLREQFGRPAHAYAVTPLAIYRAVPRRST